MLNAPLPLQTDRDTKDYSKELTVSNLTRYNIHIGQQLEFPILVALVSCRTHSRSCASARSHNFGFYFACQGLLI